jgi:hypothetical protein
MIRGVLTLFKTLVEIILLRKGPGDIPHSSTLFVIVASVWFLVGVFGVLAIETYQSSDLFVDLLLAFAGLGFYAVVISAFGRGERVLTCLTAILGCSAVFSIVLFGGRLVLPMLLTENEVNWAAGLIWFWSIPVEGHIIARTIERQWIIGLLVALFVLIVKQQLLAVIRPKHATAA